MEIIDGNKMIGGWFIGNFEPSVHKTDLFEVCYKVHKKNEEWPIHYHKDSIEFNYLIRGSMIIQGNKLKSGDIFIIGKGEVSDAIFLEKCEIIVVKVPSIPDDKYIMEDN
jgi:quercetin dioxygenase-like cupin family protein